MRGSSLWLAAGCLFLVACHLGPEGSSDGGDDQDITYTEVAQCPKVHVVSCDHTTKNSASGDPDKVVAHSCIEIFSNGSSIAEAQYNSIKSQCEQQQNSDDETWVEGSGCNGGNEKQGCLNGSSAAGYCEVQWVMADDPIAAGDWATACTNAHSSPVSP